MPRLSLAQRLLLFWFAATSAVLLVAGGVFSLLHEQQGREDSQRRLQQAMARVANDLTHHSKEIDELAASQLASPKLLATMNLFHGYFESTAGQPEIFDFPARELAEQLSENGRAAGVDWLVASSAHGPLAGYRDDQAVFWSMREGVRTQLANRPTSPAFEVLEAVSPWVSAPIRETTHLAPCRVAEGIALVREIAIRQPDGTRLGQLSLGRCLGQRFVNDLARDAGLGLAIDAAGSLRSNAFPALAAALPRPPAKAETPGWFGEPLTGRIDDIDFLTAALPVIGDGDARITFVRHRDTATTSLESLVAAAIVSLVAVSLLAMGIGLVYLRKKVMMPLDELIRAVDLAGEGNFVPLSGQLPNNELGRLGQLLNETMQRIRQRETELHAAMADLLRERSHLKTLVDTIPDLVWLKDPNGVYLGCNPGFEAFFGATESDIVGRTDHDFAPAELADSFRRHDQAAMAAGKPLVNEEWITFASNGYHGLFSTTKTPMYLPDGTLIGVLGIAHDITEMRRTMDELSAHRELLETLVRERSAQLADTQFAMDSIGIGIQWVDPETAEVIYANRHAADMLGYTPEELLERTVPEFDVTVDTPRFQEITRQAREQGQLLFESTMRHKGGHTFPVEISLYYHRGGQTGDKLIVFITDITRRKESEQALLRAKHEAEAASLSKSSFLANMSHEIRTPLNAITGMAHLIRRAGIDPTQVDRLDKIDMAGQHLLDIINAILDLSKIEAGKFTLEDTDVVLGSVLANVASMLREKALAKGIDLRIETEEQPMPLRGDPTRLQQALLNYLGNAIKFTEQGSVVIRTHFLAQSAAGMLVRFEVTDSGPGIPEEAQSRLFTAFEQADNTITRRYGGTGLGLVITRKLAQAMGGDAGVDSHPGAGSTFWFTARLAAGSSEHATPANSPGAAAEATLARDFSHCRILLAEDEPVNREVALSLFEEIGIAIDTAENGLQAVDMASATAYDLILMDMQMPRMDGLDATRAIRALPDGQRVAILAMTANAFAEDRARCLAAGMNDFIAKPVDPELLFTTVLKWLRSPPPA